MSYDEAMSIKSEIEEITVYRRNALVLRKIELPAHVPDSVKIIGLPLCLDDSSIRIKIVSPKNSISTLDFRVVLESPEPDKELPPPDNKKLFELRQMKNKIDTQILWAKKILSRINSISYPGKGIPEDTLIPSVTPINSRKMLMDYSLERKEKIGKKLRNLKIKKAKIDIDLGKLEYLISQESSIRQNRENELRKSVIISLESSEKNIEKPELFLEYLTPGTRWFPVYNLDISSDYSRYHLTMRAMIQQQTGEDWNRVRINLSTAEAVRWMELPKLSSRIFGRPKSVLPVSGWRKVPEGISALFSDYDLFADKYPQKKNINLSGIHSVKDSSDIIGEQNLFAAEAVAYEEHDEEQETVMDMETEMSIDSSSAKIAAPKMSKKLRSADTMKRKQNVTMKSFTEFNSSSSELPEESFKLTPVTVQLDYRKMRLESANSKYRGKLRNASISEMYMVSEKKANLVHSSIDTALEIISGTDPDLCSKPESFDGFDYSFKIDSLINIPSDGNYHTRTLSSYEAKGEMQYIAVPRESSDVYRFIRFSNPLDAPVLAGPIDISIGSGYILTSDINTVPPGGNIQLGIGVEQAIKISRNTVFTEETTGMIKGSLGLIHRIDMDVQNNLHSKAEIEIRERISALPDDKPEKDEKVKISILEINPEWEKYDQEPNYINGGYRWKIDVDPGGKSHIHVLYEIRIPSQYEIVGGNRREN